MSKPHHRRGESVSDRKRAANRANAKKSTGPRTPEGKARVSLNALTHGLTAHAAVLPLENPDHFEKFAWALRADLRPSGFLQTLLAERIIDLAWKLRRSSVAQTELACRLLDDHIHAHETAVKEGAYVGPFVAMNGADMVAEGVDDRDAGPGKQKPAAYLRLDLYADRLQRAMLAALMRLRREQERADDEGAASGTPADVEVELANDVAENSAMKNKATADETEDEDYVDLRSFIRYPWSEKAAEEQAEADNANSQNKATAGPEAQAAADAPPPAAAGG